MRVIQSADEETLKRISQLFPKFSKNIPYRLHKFVLMESVDDGNVVLYNTLTSEMILLESGDNVIGEYYLEHVFIVPSTFHEETLPVLIRNIYESTRPKTLFPRSYTVLTTTDCNARCFYCYQKEDPKRPMSKTVAKDAAEFMAKNYKLYRPKGAKSPLSISWFGGEPLYNKEVINIICSILKEKGISFRSTMISNGYLFGEETVNEAKNLWNLKKVQITIDGTESTYNKAKHYIYDEGKNGSPFKIVLGNIQRLVDNKIPVTVRLNVGAYNRKDLLDLVDLLGERFKGNRLLKIYTHWLFDAYNSDVKTEEIEAEVFASISEIDRKIVGLGFGGPSKSLSLYKGSHCMADSGKHMCILPDGGITLCEHYTDTNKVCTIYNFPKDVDMEMLEKYREIKPPFQQCFNCPLYMDCSTLKICSDSDEKCSVARQQYKIGKKMAAIRQSYKSWLEKNGDSLKKPERDRVVSIRTEEGIQ